MRTASVVTGAITFFFLALGALFKIMHYPGSGPILILALSILVPLTAVFTCISILRIKKNDRK